MDTMKAVRVVTRLTCLLLVMILVPASVLADTGTVNCKSLNLREKATKSSKAIQTLNKGDTVNIVDVSGGWYKVIYGSLTGYVMKEYINVTASTTVSSSSGSKTTKTTKNSKTTKQDQLNAIGRPKACSEGDTGSNVKKLQECLQVLGYYKGEIDGIYGNGTANAVKKLQKAKKLTQNGVASTATIAAMFGEKVTETSTASSKIKTERLNWFNGGQNVIPKGATFTVKDCKTGRTFTCKRWSGSNHLDAEPASASDTATMLSIYGGSWSWNRRPILVKYNGHVYAASMNGMPHGTQTIGGNNFEGHFCIHFYKSKTHGTKKVDSAHQNCVSTAMKYSW